MTQWPILMTRQTASRYLDLSEASFVREVQAGRLPDGVKVGGRMHWRRDALDAAIDRLTGNTPEPSYRRKLVEKYRGQAA